MKLNSARQWVVVGREGGREGGGGGKDKIKGGGSAEGERYKQVRRQHVSTWTNQIT